MASLNLPEGIAGSVLEIHESQLVHDENIAAEKSHVSLFPYVENDLLFGRLRCE